MIPSSLESSYGLLNPEQINLGVKDGSIVRLKSKSNFDTLIGQKCLVKVNASIGVSEKSSIEREFEKIDFLAKSPDLKPDLLMDLSISRDFSVLDYACSNLDIPVGTLPHYKLTGGESVSESKSVILETIERDIEIGVSFITIHPTANFELANLASNTRSVPITSRGGGIILRSMLRNSCKHNYFIDNLDVIAKLCSKNDVAISVGSVFRPACNSDAFDAVHLQEIELQKNIVFRLRGLGCNVFYECLGHADLNNVIKYSEVIRKNNIPMMALGPIVSDSTAGFDHVNNSIGASVMAINGGCHVINSITREEHTGLVPSFESVIEGIKSAKVAAHSVNISKFPEYRIQVESRVQEARVEKNSCVVNMGLFEGVDIELIKIGCSRCGANCPLILNGKLKGLSNGV